MSFARDALTVLGKDVRIELRTRELVVTMGFFAVLVAVICSMAFWVSEETGRQVAAGVLWVAIAFAGSLGLVRAFARERDEQAFSALLLSPASRSAIFVGKLAFTILFLLVTEAIVLPLVALFFHLSLAKIAAPLALVMFLGTVGYAIAGTVFGAMTVRTRSRDFMLSVVLYPLVMPGLLSGVSATRELFDGATFGEVAAWLRLLFVMDVLLLVACLWLFEPLMRD